MDNEITEGLKRHCLSSDPKPWRFPGMCLTMAVPGLTQALLTEGSRTSWYSGGRPHANLKWHGRSQGTGKCWTPKHRQVTNYVPLRSDPAVTPEKAQGGNLLMQLWRTVIQPQAQFTSKFQLLYAEKWQHWVFVMVQRWDKGSAQVSYLM